AKQIDAGIDEAAARPFFLEADQLAPVALHQRAVARGVRDFAPDNDAVVLWVFESAEDTIQIREDERIAIEYEPSIRREAAELDGSHEPAARAERLRLLEATHTHAGHGLCRKMPLNHGGQMTGRKRDLCHALARQVADYPFKKWPACHRRHRLGDVRQQVPHA